MAVLGVTGGVGAGKSRILTILKEEYGAAIIQADEVTRQLEDRLTAVEAALFDEKSREICDCLLFVDTDEETRIRRLIENRGYSRGQCLAVMRNQPDRESFLKLTDYVIDNNGTEEDVKRQLSEVMKEISTNETC